MNPLESSTHLVGGNKLALAGSRLVYLNLEERARAAAVWPRMDRTPLSREAPGRRWRLSAARNRRGSESAMAEQLRWWK